MVYTEVTNNRRLNNGGTIFNLEPIQHLFPSDHGPFINFGTRQNLVCDEDNVAATKDDGTGFELWKESLNLFRDSRNCRGDLLTSTKEF